jgi:hypothetical protein
VIVKPKGAQPDIITELNFICAKAGIADVCVTVSWEKFEPDMLENCNDEVRKVVTLGEVRARSAGELQ